MLEDQHLYLLPESESGTSVLDMLTEAGYSSYSAGQESHALTFYDTRSGAFFRTRIRLCHVPDRAAWQWWKNGKRLQEDPGEPAMIPFASAPDVVRSQLRIGDRLLPQLTVRLRKKTFRMLAPSGESVLLSFVRTAFSNPHRPVWIKGPDLVHVSPIGADPREVDVLGTCLRNWVRLNPVPVGLLELGLGCLKLPLPGAPVPAQLQLSPGDSMPEACRKLVARQAFKVWANTDGAILDLDPEFVHDLRVATRRCRFALRLFREVIGVESAAQLRGELRWVAQACGDVRDLDVMGETLRSRSAGDEGDAVTEPWLESLAQKRAAALAEMVKALRSDRFAALMARLDDLAVDASAAGEDEPAAISEVAPSWIRKALRKVLKWRTVDGRDLEPSEMHRLRIAFKGLRYTCEFFQEVVDPEEVGRVLSLFIRYQDCLGEYQDACVAMNHLEQLARERWAEVDNRLEEFLALGGAMEIQRQQANLRQAEFRTLWPTFPKKIGRFRKLLRSKCKAPPVPPDQPRSASGSPAEAPPGPESPSQTPPVEGS